jgi:hypothetical protein
LERTVDLIPTAYVQLLLALIKFNILNHVADVVSN